MTSGMMVAMWRLLGGLFVVALTTIGSASAQQIEIEAPVPERPRPPLLLPPGDLYETTRPYDANNYPSPPLVNFDPAFIGPLSTNIETPTSTGRVGFAGWISPNTPAGAEATGRRCDPGGCGPASTLEWRRPPPAAP